MSESSPINPNSSFTSSSSSNPSSNPAPFSTEETTGQTASDPNDPWSFGGYFSPEESKKFKEQMDKNIMNQMKKDQQKAHEASQKLKKALEGDDDIY